MDFRWSVRGDKNRASDGLDLRADYYDVSGDYADKDGPCSILEMMIALAKRCENELMYDPEKGDRTELWFWIMIDNLGLENMDDYAYDEEYCDFVLNRFLDREYESDGYNGPFFIHGFDKDMRKLELWYQLNFYLENNFPV